ncbi:MAG: selenide, water dikinase SelD [Pseudomonadota bacterium]
MHDTAPLTTDIVLVGGGHAHALLLRAWGMDPVPCARLTLINPSATAPYTGMLPGFVAGHYGRDELEIDLVRLARFAGARMIFGWATAIDREARLIEVPGRAPVPYDYASLDIGITSNMPDLPGFQIHGVAAKPLGPFADRWRAHLDGAAGPVVVIGGGVAGIELALAMQHALPSGTAVTVVEAETILPGVNPGTIERLRAACDAAGVTIRENTKVTEVRADTVLLSDGTEVAATLTVGAAGGRPFDWLSDTGLNLQNGYVAVGPDLRATNDPRVFAVGDCAHLTATPRPKAGVFAVRAAPVLTANLKAAATGQPLKPFKPQSTYLKLISLGGKAAIADKGTRSFGGAWAWRWKDWIDQRFMTRLAKLPNMAASPQPEDTPLCAGCGAKVAPHVLDRVLADLDQPFRPDVMTGPGDDAATLEIRGVRQVLTTDHLRAFWDDPWVMGRVAALHALGDVLAMGARPQAVLAQVTLPHMSDVLQERWLSEVMAAAGAVFGEEGAAIVGGHSSQGAEFSLGFTVTGLDPERALLRAEPRAGDALILTRAIGSGTLLAGEMQGRAKGDDVEHLLGVLATAQGEAARILSAEAQAMTDVTGFGLAGHAARMVRDQGLSARLDLAAVPVFPGAEALAAEGLRSSLFDGNRAAVAFDGPDTARAALLFDPQTAGGFLAAIPPERVEAVVARLQRLGAGASVIGALEPRGTAEIIVD